MADQIMVPRDFVSSVPSQIPQSRIQVHDAGDSVESNDLEQVAFYVLPYMGSARELTITQDMPNLQVVQTLTAGVDGFAAQLSDGVTLHNAPGVHDASTAELAMALMLASLRRIDDFARSSGDWLSGRYEALADKNVLIIGHGGLGKALERRLAGFEVEIARVARGGRTMADGTVVYTLAHLPELLPGADVVVLTVPLNEATRGLVDAEFLATMKPGALLVNVARGPVVVTDDLTEAVRSGRVRAALDVTDPEPLPSDHPLWSLPGVLISPHVGGNTSAFLPRAQRLVAEQLERWVAGEPLAHRAN
jgi:phosphoglycerate dehydrogenase-like enzyme